MTGALVGVNVTVGGTGVRVGTAIGFVSALVSCRATAGTDVGIAIGMISWLATNAEYWTNRK